MADSGLNPEREGEEERGRSRLIWLVFLFSLAAVNINRGGQEEKDSLAGQHF